MKDKLGLSWPEFLDALVEIDAALIEQGTRIMARPLQADIELCRRCGHSWIMTGGTKDPITALVHEVYETMYGRENLYIGPIHVGAIMFRDAFFEVAVPGGSGTVRIEPWKHVQGITQTQTQIFYSLSPEEFDLNTDQLIDIFDFGWAVADSHRSQSTFSEFLTLAHEQMEGACRTLRGSFSQRVAIQGAAYAVELTAKALLAKNGLSKADVKELSHSLAKAIDAVAMAYPQLDAARCRRSLAHIPNVIDERYNFANHNRSAIGAVLRHAQYLIAEMTRQVTDRNLRDSLKPPMPRRFPT